MRPEGSVRENVEQNRAIVPNWTLFYPKQKSEALPALEQRKKNRNREVIDPCDLPMDPEKHEWCASTGYMLTVQSCGR